MLDETAKGVFTIAATPFLPDGALDTQSLDRMVDFYLEKGATGLTILGMMGEAGKLTAAESASVIETVCARANVPVVVGVSAAGFAAIEALTAVAMDKGAAGVMVAPPGSLRTDKEILGYYRTVGERLGDVPWVLQDFPLVTGVKIDTDIILKIVEECPRCVMLKHEDWPGLEKISALRKASDAGARRISILCGNGGQFLLEEMLRGADGAMTGFAYPEMMADVVRLMSAGDETAARDLFDAYLPLVRYESQPGLGLAIRKHILAKRGAIAHPTVRAPGPKLSADTLAEVETLIARQEARLAGL
ncbi:dihydrodipicolinate synthase family protein [Alphaproteobacteria bacterium GH1-50]|uniref:Dihydrodipicolinate synthase family protein n=1 Tax=Kangsaoukella pontilimi TaxID=2691042 RepID=A0A7C9MUP0_9RHOB|nr:dihydrodipicolinate synthase family protein [Kangsaoukella pontilimi]MXQ06294.1 dihydrodipicolinate synthase family protein [Kangsaoukella pontilimi]